MIKKNQNESSGKEIKRSLVNFIYCFYFIILMKVTPWEVSGKVDYDKLMKEFGVEKIDDKLLMRIKKHTGDLHIFLRRKLFFCHRDMNWLLDEYEKGNKFYLYTGRGPSGNMHLGHLIPFMFTKWLQDKFDVPLYIQLTDDEKFLVKEKLSLEETHKLAYDNALDILAPGFKPGKTFVFSDLDYAKTLYRNSLLVAKKLNFSTTKAVFGLTNETNVGQIFFTAMQSVPAFLPSIEAGKNIPCLIPHGIDQDAHFRITRDILPKLGFFKPASIQSQFIPKLTGMEGKMSASEKETAIYLTDDEKTVANKIRKYAFSGGQASIKEHREKGGNPDVDISFIWLKMIFEDNDEKLKKIHDDYKSGKMLTSELKEILIEKINRFLIEHRKNKEKVKLDKFLLKD